MAQHGPPKGASIAAVTIALAITLYLTALWSCFLIHATRWFKAANFNQSEPMVRTVGDHGGHNGTADATAQEEGRAKVVRRSGNVQPLGAPAFLIVSLVVLLSAPVMAGSTADMDTHQTSIVNSLTMMALLLAGWSASTVVFHAYRLRNHARQVTFERVIALEHENCRRQPIGLELRHSGRHVSRGPGNGAPYGTFSPAKLLCSLVLLADSAIAKSFEEIGPECPDEAERAARAERKSRRWRDCFIVSSVFHLVWFTMFMAAMWHARRQKQRIKYLEQEKAVIAPFQHLRHAGRGQSPVGPVEVHRGGDKTPPLP